MDSYPRVVIGTDGSTDATAAVRLGGKIASRLSVPVTLVSVWSESEREAVSIVSDAKSILSELGISDITISTPEGDPGDVLVDVADDDPRVLLVVGSSGLNKATSRIVGSTSNRLSHHSKADVLFARDPLPTRWNHVALATDGSESSHRAVRRGITLAIALHAHPRLITGAKNLEQGEEAMAGIFAELTAKYPDADIQREVLEDPQAATAVINAGWKYDLVVIGNKSMSGPARLLGSVANKITHGLECNLLLANTNRE
ncbi:universal stress protein [Smaragdicoccus niigatensis]